LPGAGIDELAVIGVYVEALLHLTDHHKDPFDRILICPGASRANETTE